MRALGGLARRGMRKRFGAAFELPPLWLSDGGEDGVPATEAVEAVEAVEAAEAVEAVEDDAVLIRVDRAAVIVVLWWARLTPPLTPPLRLLPPIALFLPPSVLRVEIGISSPSELAHISSSSELARMWSLSELASLFLIVAPSAGSLAGSILLLVSSLAWCSIPSPVASRPGSITSFLARSSPVLSSSRSTSAS